MTLFGKTADQGYGRLVSQIITFPKLKFTRFLYLKGKGSFRGFLGKKMMSSSTVERGEQQELV